MMYKSGVVAVVGSPNVGKSTLINSLLGQKIAIVSSKPQTTREAQRGILTTENTQVVFVDTPGIHRPNYVFGGLRVRHTTKLDGLLDDVGARSTQHRRRGPNVGPTFCAAAWIWHDVLDGAVPLPPTA